MNPKNKKVMTDKSQRDKSHILGMHGNYFPVVSKRRNGKSMRVGGFYFCNNRQGFHFVLLFSIFLNRYFVSISNLTWHLKCFTAVK